MVTIHKVHFHHLTPIAQYTKTTYDPDGNIVHVKDKINGETINGKK